MKGWIYICIARYTVATQASFCFQFALLSTPPAKLAEAANKPKVIINDVVRNNKRIVDSLRRSCVTRNWSLSIPSFQTIWISPFGQDINMAVDRSQNIAMDISL